LRLLSDPDGRKFLNARDCSNGSIDAGDEAKRVSSMTTVFRFGRAVSHSRVMQNVLGTLNRLAPTEITITLGILPRVLALDNIPSQLDGNSTLLVIDRIGGDLRESAAMLGPLFGILYDQSENRRVQLANDAIRRRAVTIADLAPPVGGT